MDAFILQLIWVPFALVLALALAIAIHHLYIHSQNKYDKAQLESYAILCYLQPSDMANHEIWVVSFLSMAVTWVIAGYVFESRLRCGQDGI